MKQHLILGGILLHFLIGFGAAIPAHYYVRQNLPGSRLLDLYSAMHFNQSWPMYSPPPKRKLTFKFSGLTESGWTPLAEPFPEESRKSRSSVVLMPRGTMRLLAVFFTHNDLLLLQGSDDRKFFYQQLSDYYCFGDGKIAGLRKIRFFQEAKAAPLFYTKDRFDRDISAPNDQLTALYERDCSDI